MRLKINIAVSAAAILLLGTTVTGCDFLRKVAGRPTSAQLEAAVARREAEEEARHQARLDSARQVAQAVADSLKALEEQQAVVPEIRNYIIMGSFAEPKHAQRKKRMLEADGYKAEIFRLNSGLHAVGIEGAVTLEETKQMLETLKRKKICSQGSWVYVKP